MFAGEIQQLWRYPVKGLRGESLSSAVVDFHGMAGDRALGVYDQGTGKAVWGGSHPKLMGWEAAYPAQCGCADSASGDPVLYEPGGAAWGADESGLPARLAGTVDAARGVELRAERREYGRLHVVFAASIRELGARLGREYKAERFRPNVVAEADLEPFAEAAIEPGTVIRLGGNEFTYELPCERCVLPSWDPAGANERDMAMHRFVIEELGNCFGFYVRTSERVTVRVGDPISG